MIRYYIHAMEIILWDELHSYRKKVKRNITFTGTVRYSQDVLIRCLSELVLDTLKLGMYGFHFMKSCGVKT